MRQNTTFTIGELVRELGLPAETIRYYEREGLLPSPERSPGNYRRYTDAHRERLAFIRNCRSLDMTLEEVRSLLTVKDAPEKGCEEVNALIDCHIGHVAERIAELRRLSQQLRALRDQCTTTRRGQDCAILKKLSSPVSRDLKRARRTHVG
jgi:Cd(II)/Pb(II)-responsive transcriptional regulator